MSAPSSSADVAASLKAASSAPSFSAGCRLLWRGGFSHAKNVYSGIAIVAHLFAVPSLSSPAHLSSSSPFHQTIDDPFSPFASGIDICLGLEMMRSADLRVLGDVYITHSSTSSSLSVSNDAKAKGGKGKAKARAELSEIIVETPTDVRVYIDQQCAETVNWFEKSFCSSDRRGIGIRLEVGGEEVVIFATYPAGDVSTDPLVPKPAVTLLLGRAAQLRVRKPRPDDPMPRESLFANKLRRTTSMPILSLANYSSFGFPPSKLKPSKIKTRVSKTLTGLLNGEKLLSSSMVAKSTKEKLSTSRSHSTAEDPFIASATIPNERSTKAASSKRKAQGAGTPGRRGEKRIRRSESLRIEEDRQLLPDEEDFVPGSPTPSNATTYGGGAFDEGNEDVDVLTDLPQFVGNGSSRAPSVRAATMGGGVGADAASKRSLLQRSSSLPVGLFSTVAAVPARSSSVVEQLEGKNKATLRKLVLAGLSNHGLGRADAEFKDVFSNILKGVQFALRSTIKIFPIDRTLAAMLITNHAQMYIAPTSPPPPPTLPTSVLPLEVKREFDKEMEQLERARSQNA